MCRRWQIGGDKNDVLRTYGGHGALKLLFPIRASIFDRRSCKFPHTWGQDNPRGYPKIDSSLNTKQISSGRRRRDEPSCTVLFQFQTNSNLDCLNVSLGETLSFRIRGINTPARKSCNGFHSFTWMRTDATMSPRSCGITGHDPLPAQDLWTARRRYTMPYETADRNYLMPRLMYSDFATRQPEQPISPTQERLLNCRGGR